MPEEQNFPFRIEGINIQKGLERFGGNKESYLQILQSYASTTPLLLERAASVTPDNLEDYAVTVHGIKSSSRSICAEDIGVMAEALEKAAKAGDIDYVNANNGIFTETAGRIILNITELLNHISRSNPKPKKDMPDKDVLSKLFSACTAYDMDGVDEAMAELEYYTYESGGDLAAWLRENVDKMNFAQITEKLSSLEKE